MRTRTRACTRTGAAARYSRRGRRLRPRSPLGLRTAGERLRCASPSTVTGRLPCSVHRPRACTLHQRTPAAHERRVLRAQQCVVRSSLGLPRRIRAVLCCAASLVLKTDLERAGGSQLWVALIFRGALPVPSAAPDSHPCRPGSSSTLDASMPSRSRVLTHSAARLVRTLRVQGRPDSLECRCALCAMATRGDPSRLHWRAACCIGVAVLVLPHSLRMSALGVQERDAALLECAQPCGRPPAPPAPFPCRNSCLPISN